MKKYLVILFLISNIVLASSQSIEVRVYGLYNKTEQINTVDNSGGSIRGFESKYGYQGGIAYTKPIYKSFFISSEIGYLTKGYQTINTATLKKVLDVNYKYIYFKPSVGYNWRGLALSAGLFLNFLRNKSRISDPWKNNIFPKVETASSFELSYQYKRIGLSISMSKNTDPMRTIEFFGDEFTHYHHWYSIGLSYAVYQR